MTDHYIAFYVSSHGFGHLTRSLALIEHILSNTKYKIYLCSNFKQIEFGKIYLNEYEGRVMYSIKETDVGLVNKNQSLDVDKVQTEKELRRLLNSYKDTVEEEVKNLSNYEIQLIVSDISALAFLIGEQMSIKVIGIGNFNWIDQYISIGLKADIIEELKNIYKKGTYFIKYDLSLQFNGIQKDKILESDYLVSRPIKRDRVKEIITECQSLYTNKTNRTEKPEILYISLGKSAELPTMKISNFKGIVIYTDGVHISLEENDKDILLIKLPNEIKDSQSYLAASNLVIAKAGWSTTAESLIAHSMTALIMRPGVDDDMNTIQNLEQKRLAISITENDLIHLDYAYLKSKAYEEIDINRLNSINNDTEKVCNKIMEFIVS